VIFLGEAKILHLSFKKILSNMVKGTFSKFSQKINLEFAGFFKKNGQGGFAKIFGFHLLKLPYLANRF
jgi:ribosomal protein L6P/L9E